MANEVKLSVAKVVGHSLCVASSDGDKLYEHIAKALEAKSCVTLSFSGVTLLTPVALCSISVVGLIITIPLSVLDLFTLGSQVEAANQRRLAQLKQMFGGGCESLNTYR